MQEWLIDPLLLPLCSFPQYYILCFQGNFCWSTPEKNNNGTRVHFLNLYAISLIMVWQRPITLAMISVPFPSTRASPTPFLKSIQISLDQNTIHFHKPEELIPTVTTNCDHQQQVPVAWTLLFIDNTLGSYLIVNVYVEAWYIDWNI